jgi:TPR repeat protein
MPTQNAIAASILALLLFLPLPSTAGPLNDGLTAFNSGNYQRAFSLWKPLAEAGDARARYNLGLLFQQGLGVEKNLPQARLLFTAAAKQGDTDAQYQLGVIFYQGEGVFRSNKEAHRWWSQAAAKHHPGAQFNLGTLYAYGIGVERAPEKTLKLWESAAEQGHRDAIKVMIRIHRNGEFGAAISTAQVEYWQGRLDKH